MSDHGGTPLDMITVDYPDGNRIVHRLRLGRDLSDRERAIIDQHTAGLDRGDIERMLLILVEQTHDEAAYRRVCERRGVLAL